MRFWSKGLGEKTIDLFLSKSESVKSRGVLYLKGQMEAPVSWDYIMPMTEDDIIDFFALLKDPAVADYIYKSPERWQLYRDMTLGGLKIALLVLIDAARRVFGGAGSEEEVVIQVPPPMERKRGRSVRRRLGSKPSALAGAEVAVEANGVDHGGSEPFASAENGTSAAAAARNGR